MIPDRRVHAECGAFEVVRYNRAGKWYVEPRDGGKRKQVGIVEAARSAREAASSGGEINFGLPGGATFDRCVEAPPNVGHTTLRLVPDLSPDGFLRECYDEWVADADYYRAHPEEDCPASYLKIPPFEQYVAEIAEERVAEIQQFFDKRSGFSLETESR